MDSDDISALVDVFHAARYRSRRQAKRLLREAGGRGDAKELDAVLALVRAHPRREEIISLAEAREAARLEAERRAADAPPEHPEWLVSETPGERSTWLVHLCPGGSYSFVGRVFDDNDECPPDMERYELDDGQWLSQICWLDGHRPEGKALAALMAEARRELRVYDAELDA